MIVKATQNNTRQTPRKVRMVANAVKAKPILQAVESLSVMDREASLVVLKVLRQAIANATHNYNLQVADLKIKNIIVDGGPQYKRWQAVSRGRAHSIAKKTCHVTVELEQLAATKPLSKAKQSVKVTPSIQEADQSKTKTTKHIPSSQDKKKGSQLKTTAQTKKAAVKKQKDKK